MFVLPHPYVDYLGWSMMYISVGGLLALALHHFKIRTSLIVVAQALQGLAAGAIWYVASCPVSFAPSENDRLPMLSPMRSIHHYYEFEATDLNQKIVTLGASGCIHGPFEVFDHNGQSIFNLPYGEDIPTGCSKIMAVSP